MAITPATAWGAQMTKLAANQGGQVSQLIESYNNGKNRCFIETVTYAAQASGTVIGVARLPVPFTLLGIMLITSASTATATLALGNAGDTNGAIYKAAAVLTATDTPTWYGLTAKTGVLISSGVDYLGAATSYASPGTVGGGGYEDIILTVGTAALPGAGTLRLFFHYMID